MFFQTLWFCLLYWLEQKQEEFVFPEIFLSTDLHVLFFMYDISQRLRWGCFCWIRKLTCFGSQKRTKRIVPSSRTPDGNITANRVHGGLQAVGMPNQTTTISLSLLAPPSSPASFTNSAIPSTAQSPNYFLSLSANSPGGPSSTMFATGPYAHETQLVSPPVFSTFTTEPSTAPLTPPPELAHYLTTPSSPDVPYARYLSSGKENGLPFVSTGYISPNDLRVTYPFYPKSPASSIISPMSVTPRTGRSTPFPEREGYSLASDNNSPCLRYRPCDQNNSLSSSNDFMVPSAQFHLDQQVHERNPDQYQSYPIPCGNKHNKSCIKDAEEVEAYRASFGFSTDEVITTPSYVEIPDETDISFSVPAFTNNQSCSELYSENSKSASPWAGR